MTGKRIAWNYDWKFAEEFLPDMLTEEYCDENMQQIKLPHTNKILPFHYFDEKDYQMVSAYRKTFEPDSEWSGNNIIVHFEAVAHHAEIFLNGNMIAKHDGGYTAFQIDITEALEYGKKNVLCVMADSRENLNIPPFGNVVDYMTYGGIYREVFLKIRPQTYIIDLFSTTGDTKEDEKRLYCSMEIKGSGKVQIRQLLLKGETVLGTFEDEGVLSKDEVFPVKSILASKTMEEQIQLWSPENPVLYTLITQIVSEEEVITQRQDSIGFRRIGFKEDGFYLNGKKYKIRGLNRHQSYPYIGYAAPKRLQRQDVSILKKELGLNAVRTSHYPQSRHFLDACDEQGLLVFTELPGWQHIGNEEWKQCAIHNLEEMIIEQRNHPSIIIWGVRINESEDDDAFYLKTNEVAHSLDPSRQTGGVRFIKKSHLLEDVYTYNDFSHRGNNPGIEPKNQVTPDPTKPYLITEYNGHMFPTKAFDAEMRRMEHALRHACVMDAYYGDASVAGGFGWCMADYNTHKDFGSGDRICYHGVLDMFRNPKAAAAAYASQQEEEMILELPSSLNIGEHNGGYLPELYAYTNAEKIRLYKNNIFVKEFYPDTKKYPNLIHAPFCIDDFVGELMEQGEQYPHNLAEGMKEVLAAFVKYGQTQLPLKYKLKMLRLMLLHKITFADGIRLYNTYLANWGGAATSYRFDAIKNEKIVKTIIKESVFAIHLEVDADTQLSSKEDTYDMTLVRIRIVDQNNNILPYYQEPLMIQAHGAIEIVGPDVISLKGGMGGTFVRTLEKEGEGILTIKGLQVPELEIKFAVQ